MKSSDIVKLIIAAAILFMVWQSGILDSLAANLAQPEKATQPIQGTPEILFIVATAEPMATPSPTLPALPAMGPYTYEQYQECHKLKVDGRLHELEREQFNLCSVYTED